MPREDQPRRDVDILLSIEPKFCIEIFLGIKKWEFRKQKPRVHPRRVYLYCVEPVRAVAGYCEIGRILSGTPQEIWSRCGEEGGISKEEFIARFGGKKLYAMEIVRARRFRRILPLARLGVNRPPRSFLYLNKNEARG